jgi:hypothetical protein
MKTIKITPNGVTLSALLSYGRNIERLVTELQACYRDNYDRAEAERLIKHINGVDHVILDMPEIEVDFEFIEAKKR